MSRSFTFHIPSSSLATRLFILALILVPLTLNFLKQAAPASAGSCAEDPANRLLNGVMQPGPANSYGVVAANWNAFVVGANKPHFENADNEGWDPYGSQFIWADYMTFDAGIYQKVTNLTAGQTYHYWLVWGQAQHDVMGSNSPTNQIERQIGIDLSGGTDPTSVNVQWSRPLDPSRTSGFNRPEWNLYFVAPSSTATFFLRVINHHTDYRNKVFFDTACLYPAPGSPTTTPWATRQASSTPSPSATARTSTPVNTPTNTPTRTPTNVPACAPLGGTVFNDLNGDGVQNAGEAGLAGRKVIVKDSATGLVLARTLTDSNGNYAFSNLDAGRRAVISRVGTDYVSTTKRRVVVTLPPCPTINFGLKLQPTPTPSPTPTNSGTSLIWDSRLTQLNVSLQPATVASGTTYWKLIRADLNDPFQHCGDYGGDHDIYYVLTNESGARVSGQQVMQGWPDGTANGTTNSNGVADIPMWANYWPQNGPGPYRAWVTGQPSDTVSGMGLPGNNHVSFILYYQRIVAGTNPPAPTFPPIPNCSGTTSPSGMSLDRDLRNAPATCVSIPDQPSFISPRADEHLSTRAPRFDWNDASCATSYKVQLQSVSPTGPLMVDASMPKSEYQMLQTLPPSIYFVRIRACNKTACSDWSEWRAFYVD